MPSNRLWMMRCDWVTTISRVTWVQPNWRKEEEEEEEEERGKKGSKQCFDPLTHKEPPP